MFGHVHRAMCSDRWEVEVVLPARLANFVCMGQLGALSVECWGTLALMCAVYRGVGGWPARHGTSIGCSASLLRTVVHSVWGGGGGVGQLGMAHRSDGPASSLRMFGHVHWAMCGGGGGGVLRSC